MGRSAYDDDDSDDEQTQRGSGKPSEVEALAHAFENLYASEIIKMQPDADGGFARIIELPQGRKLISLKPFADEWRTRPERRQGTAELTTLESFVAHANRFKDAGSALFADDDTKDPSLTSVLDYSEAGDAGARFGKHRGHYRFPVSDSWQAWRDVHKRELTQTQFAQLIEDRIFDIVEPDYQSVTIKEFSETLNFVLAKPGQMLELSKGLTLYSSQRVIDHQNLQTGEGRVTFDVEHKDPTGNRVSVPGGFVLGIPVFRGEDPFYVPVRLRYRVKEGRVSWTCDLYRMDLVFRTQLDAAFKRAATETALPLFYGSPE